MLGQALEEGWTVSEMEDRLELLFTQYSEGDVSAEDFAWFSERMPQHRREVIARTGNQPMKLAVNLYEVSLSALLEGDLPRAAATWPEAVIYAKAAGDAMTLGCVYRVKGQVLAAQDALPQAASAWQKARTYFEQVGDERACHEVQALLNNAASYL